MHKKLGGKAVWLALIVAVVMSFGSFQLAKAQCEIDPCPGVIWQSFGVGAFFLPDFPTCPIAAAMMKKKCPDGMTYYKVGHISYSTTSSNPDCIALAALAASNLSLLHEKIIDYKAEELFASDLATHPGDPSFLCPGGHQTYNSFLAGCYRYCRYDDTSEGMVYQVPQECGGGNCCLVRHEICHDPVTGLNSVVKTVTRISTGSLTCVPPFTPGCPSTLVVPYGISGDSHAIPHSGTSDCLQTSCNE